MNLPLSMTMNSRVLAITFFLLCTYFSNAQNGDNLLKKSRVDYDTSSSIACYELGKKLFSSSMDSALIFFEKGADIAEKLNFSRGKILNWRSMGAVLGRLGKYEEALGILQKGLHMIEAEKLPVMNQIDFLINIGAAHHFAGFTGKAIESYIVAVDLAREHGFEDKRSMLLNNLGIFYRSLNRHKEAIEIYKESMSIREANKDTIGLASVKHNMGVAFYKMGQYEKALENYTESKKLYIYLASSKDLLINQIAVGEVLTEMGKYDDAISKLEPLLNNKQIEGIDHTTKYILYANLAKSYLNQKKYRQALQTLNQIEPILDSSDLSPQRIDFSELKATTLTLLGRHAEANVYLKNYIKLSKDQVKEESRELLKEMETKYLSIEKDHEISLLNSNSVIQNLQIEKKNKQLFYFGAGLLLAIFALYSFILAYRTKIKANKTLNDKNIQLQEALDSNKMLVKEIHHRVKNNLQVVSSLLNLQSRFEQDDTVIKAINTGKYRVQSMSLLHQSLYLNEDLNSINIKKYFEELALSLVKGFPLFGKEVDLILDIEDLQLDVDVVVPMGLISNELITNCLKYAYENTNHCELSFSIKESDNMVRLMVKDNGVGIGFTELPERSKSMGMQLIKSFAGKIKSKIEIDNFKGTEFKFTFSKPNIKSNLKAIQNVAS
ncbi:MAG: tetratricopeptide repeat protein [Saprospiraceae bacterium]